MTTKLLAPHVIATPDILRQCNDINHDQHETNWADLVLQEVSEAIEEAQSVAAGSSTDTEHLITECIQAAALLVAWVGHLIEATIKEEGK